MAKIILGFVGEIASGKGTATEYLKKKYSAPVYRFSTMLRDVLQRLHLEINRDNLQEISKLLRAKFGQDLMAKVVAKDVEKDSAPAIAIDGVRRIADIKYLKELPGFHLVYLTADEKIRYDRLVKRGENTDDKEKTFAQFQKDQQAEAEQEILATAKTAEFTINNNGTIEKLYQQIDDIIKKIK